MATATAAALRPLRVARRAATARWFALLAALTTDVTLTLASFALAYAARYRWQVTLLPHAPTVALSFAAWYRFEILLTVLVITSLALAGVYRQRLGREWIDECWLIARATTVAMAVMIVFISIVDPDFQHSRGVLVYTWLLLIAILSLGKLVLTRLLRYQARTRWGGRRVLVVGATPAGRVIMQNLLRRRDRGYDLVGFVQERGAGPLVDFGRFKALGTVETIGDILRDHQIDEVIVALPSGAHADVVAVREQCTLQGVASKLMPDLYDLNLSRVAMDAIAGIPLIDVRNHALSGFNLVVKRALDIVLAWTILLVSLPILVIVALAVRLDSRGPIILAQERVGRGGKPFVVYKFRSMFQNADAEFAKLRALNQFQGPHFKMRNDPRRTRVGRIIRRLSIDELPQIWNVLKGDMSIVGPRPPLPREVQNYQPWHMKRLDAQPGITGLWQVSGRNSVPFDEMVVMDCYYIDNWSLALDLRILLQTVAAVVTMRGAS